MTQSNIRINGDTVIAVGEIKEVRSLTDIDRERLKKDLPHVDADQFHTRIETNSRVRFARETIEEMGLGLVEFVPGRYVPAANIESATELGDEEKTKLSADDRYTLKHSFASRVELKSGKIKLSTLTADRLMNDRNLAMSLRGRAPGSGNR